MSYDPLDMLPADRALFEEAVRLLRANDPAIPVVEVALHVTSAMASLAPRYPGCEPPTPSAVAAAASAKFRKISFVALLNGAGEALFGNRWQSAMARLLGVSPAAVGQWLYGCVSPSAMQDALPVLDAALAERTVEIANVRKAIRAHSLYD